MANELEQIRKAQEAQERAEARYARMDLLERLRKDRAEAQERKTNIYYGDPAMEYMADVVHWSMEKSAVENGPIKSHADGLAILHTLNTAYQSLIEDKAPPANFDEEVNMLLAEIAAVAMRIAIDLGTCDEVVVDDVVVENSWQDDENTIFID